MKTTFQVIQKNENGNEVIDSHTTQSDVELPMSVKALFDALVFLGKVVFISKFKEGDKEAKIIKRSWVS